MEKTFRLSAIFSAIFSGLLCIGELVVFFLLLTTGALVELFILQIVISLILAIFFGLLTFYIIDSELKLIAQHNSFQVLKETCFDNFVKDNAVADKVKLLEDKVKELEDKLNNKTTTKKKD